MQLKSSLIFFNHHFDSPVIPTEQKRLRIIRFLAFFIFIGFLEVTLGDVVGDFQSQPRSQPRFMEATISVIFNKFKVLKNGESPIMVRVAKDGKRSMKSLGVSVNPIYWDFDKHIGIFHLNKVIYASFLLKCHFFSGSLLAI